jgi:hypothetical protein
MFPRQNFDFEPTPMGQYNSGDGAVRLRVCSLCEMSANVFPVEPIDYPPPKPKYEPTTCSRYTDDVESWKNKSQAHRSEPCWRSDTKGAHTWWQMDHFTALLEIARCFDEDLERDLGLGALL